MLVSPKHLIFTSALMLAGSPIFGSEKTPAVAPMAGPTAVVKCPGMTSIDYTADQEQALPLRIAGSLACGETVAVLSDNEGYTAHIRTRDGKEGYVARMYLEAQSEAEAPAPLETPHPAEMAPANGVARWEAGAPGCEDFLSHGRHVESITANGITVQVSLQDSGWKLRVNVAIANQTGSNIDVLPNMISMDELQPNLKAMLPTAPEKLAHAPTHQVMWTSIDAIPSPSAVAPRSPGAPTAGPLEHRASLVRDYLSPQLTLVSGHPGAFARGASVDVEALALKSGSLPSGQNTAGVMWFDRDGNARELSFRVPVGDTVFDFAFSLDQKK